MRANLLGKREDSLESIEIMPMQHDVKAERQTDFLDNASDVEFGSMRASSGDEIGEHRFIGLDAELDRVKSSSFQLLRAGESKANAARDQIGVETGLMCRINNLRQIAPKQRFAARDANVENAQRRSLTKYARPFLCVEFRRAGGRNRV